jgi:hypothetical protein
LLNQQRVAGDLANAKKNAVAVERAERDRPQNKEIEGSGKQLGLVGHLAPPKTVRRLARSLLSCQGERGKLEFGCRRVSSVKCGKLT